MGIIRFNPLTQPVPLVLLFYIRILIHARLCAHGFLYEAKECLFAFGGLLGFKKATFSNSTGVFETKKSNYRQSVSPQLRRWPQGLSSSKKNQSSYSLLWSDLFFLPIYLEFTVKCMTLPVVKLVCCQQGMALVSFLSSKIRT